MFAYGLFPSWEWWAANSPPWWYWLALVAVVWAAWVTIRLAGRKP